jgi:hypothetical protein
MRRPRKTTRRPSDRDLARIAWEAARASLMAELPHGTPQMTWEQWGRYKRDGGKAQVQRRAWIAGARAIRQALENGGDA